MTRLVAIFSLCTSLISWCQDKPFIDSLNNISHSELIKNLEVSETRFLEVVAQAKILNYDQGLAEAYQHLSIVNYYLKRSDQGLDYSLKAALIFEQQNNFDALANVYSDIGFVIKDINLEQGLQYFRVAIELSEKHNLLKYKEKFYNNYGILQQKVPNLDSALFYHQKSLAIAQSLSQIEAIPYSLNNIATVLSLKGNFEKALVIMDESDSLRKLEQNEFNWADNLAYRADIYFNQENYLEAVFYYKQALDIAQKTHFQNLVKFTLERLSLSYEKL
jgi:tetratricopeptide (TPR) repeat protein